MMYLLSDAGLAFDIIGVILLFFSCCRGASAKGHQSSRLAWFALVLLVLGFAIRIYQ